MMIITEGFLYHGVSTYDYVDKFRFYTTKHYYFDDVLLEVWNVSRELIINNLPANLLCIFVIILLKCHGIEFCSNVTLRTLK